MNILRLDLKAFGPFSDLSLCFDEDPPAAPGRGLHIVYGPNEAGKSSALRALQGLLFGIPERSTDDFVHKKGDLRIGAALSDSQGKRLECVRRKGRLNTLRDGADNEPVDPQRLHDLLGGVSEDFFCNFFGIDHQRLIAGGQAVVQGEGEVGQLLFAAAGGLDELRKVQESLLGEAEELFAPRATSKRINQQLSELEKARKAIREAQLPSAEWAAHDQAHREALERKELIEQELRKLQVEQRRLERLRDALPVVRRRERLREELHPLADVQVLRPDFRDERVEVAQSLLLAEKSRGDAQAALQILDKELASLVPPLTLLEQSAAIDRLYRQVGSYQQAHDDLPKRRSERDELLHRSRQMLLRLGRDAGLDNLDGLRLDDPRRARIQALASRHAAVEQEVDSAAEQVGSLRRQQTQQERELAALPPARDATSLRQAIGRVAQQGPIEAQLAAAQENFRRLASDADRDFQKLGLWTGEPDRLETAALPTDETVERFREALAECERELKQAQAACAEAQGQIAALDVELEQLRFAGEVPSEQDLEQARQQRDAGWQLLRAQWQQGRRDAAAEQAYLAAFSGTADLAAAFELAMRRADELSDRLRREATRVERQAQLRAVRRQHEDRFTRTTAHSEQAAQRLAQERADWVAVWKLHGMTPQSPREMSGWLKRQQQWAVKLRESRAVQEEAAALTERRSLSLRDLSQALRAAGEQPDDSSLMAAVAQAERLCESVESAADQRGQAERDLHRWRSELPAAEEQVRRGEERRSAWRKDWGVEMQRLGLPETALPAEAAEAIKCIDELFLALDRSRELAGRIEQMESHCAAFAAEVRAVAGPVAADLAEAPPDEAAAAMVERLRRGRSEQQRQQELQERQCQQASDLSAAERAIKHLQQRLAALCQEAGCDEPSELPAAEERSRRRSKLEDELQATERQLAELARSDALESFASSAAALDADQLDQELARLGEQVEAQVQAKEAAIEAVRDEHIWLKAHDGSADAAEAAERQQEIMAALSGNVEHYARLRLASAVLRRAIDRHREKNQDPVLLKASQYFAELTGGSFQALRTELNDDGRQVLVGVRAGTAEHVHVRPGMSDGTADQLYLALRLASLERYLEQKEPPPLIVDDILIRFDDERSTATLRALARLGERMQVIFFTHHRHLLELAERELPAAAWTAHELNSRVATNRPVSV